MCCGCALTCQPVKRKYLFQCSLTVVLVVEGKEAVNALSVLVLQLTTVFHIFAKERYRLFVVICNLAKAVALVVKVSWHIGVVTCDKLFLVKLCIENRLAQINKVENSRGIVG